MKKQLKYFPLLLLVALLPGCEENEIMPSYTKVGTSTSTVVMIALPDDPITPSQMVEVSVSYVNPTEDPLQSATLSARVDGGNFVQLESWNVTSETKDELITHTVMYEAPATVGAEVVFEVILTSGAEYEQRKRSSFDVADPG